MPPLSAGDLDRRIRIEVGTETAHPNGSGEQVTTWATLARVWASVQPLQGRERFTAQQVAAEIDTRIRIRYRSDVQPERTRVVDENDRVFDVKSVLELGRRDGLEILATARGEVPPV